jgi:hypothetical protein
VWWLKIEGEKFRESFFGCSDIGKMLKHVCVNFHARFKHVRLQLQGREKLHDQRNVSCVLRTATTTVLASFSV